MSQLLSNRNGAVDELEGHLRDEVDALTRAGRPADEALDVAMSRLGQPADLGAEYAKNPALFTPWLPVRVAWLCGALLAVATIVPMWPKLAAGGTTALLAGHMAAVMVGYVAVFLVGFLASCYFLARPFRDLSTGQEATLRRAGLILSGAAAALTAGGILVGTVFCPDAKTGWAFGLSTHEVCGLGVLAWTAVMFAGFWRQRRAVPVGTLMVLGVVGNVLVLFAWLGATAIEQQLNGRPVSYAPVVSLVLAQAVIGAAALAPAGCLRTTRV